MRSYHSFYVLLYSAETGIPAHDIQAMFLLLGRARLEAVIFGLLRELVSPDVPFAPGADPKTACKFCDFTGICGTGWLER
ncbi:MAG: hypothetical protein NT005_03150 [Spirochaetes bacterium]|nr:hypothetical protein [Spirochaetota bacterium]